MKNIDILIISPGLLETGTNRGGGCEVTDYIVAGNFQIILTWS